MQSTYALSYRIRHVMFRIKSSSKKRRNKGIQQFPTQNRIQIYFILVRNKISLPILRRTEDRQAITLPFLYPIPWPTTKPPKLYPLLSPFLIIDLLGKGARHICQNYKQVWVATPPLKNWNSIYQFRNSKYLTNLYRDFC